jgi:hypothetical protein
MKQSEHTLALGLAAYSVSHVSNLDLRSPDELVLAVDGARGRKLVWVVQTSYGDVHAPGLLITDPRERRTAHSAKCPRNANGRVVGLGRAVAQLELVGTDKNPTHRLGASGASAIGTMTYQRLFRHAGNGVPDLATETAARDFG